VKCACDVCGTDVTKPPYCDWCALSCYPRIDGNVVEVPRHMRVVMHAALRRPSVEEMKNAAKHAALKTLMSIFRGGR
jgi:hypothetical protein